MMECGGTKRRNPGGYEGAALVENQKVQGLNYLKFSGGSLGQPGQWDRGVEFRAGAEPGPGLPLIYNDPGWLSNNWLDGRAVKALYRVGVVQGSNPTSGSSCFPVRWYINMMRNCPYDEPDKNPGQPRIRITPL